MVQPDRPTPEKTSRQQPRIVVIGVSALVFVLAAFAIGRLTAPEVEEAAPPTTDPGIATPVTSTTTTVFDPDDFRVVEIATGPPVVWARVHGLPPTFPVALVSHQDRAYLFGTERPWWGRDPTSGVEVWSTQDGIFWSGHGQVIGPDYRLTEVVSTEHGLIAIGENLAQTEPAMWMASDMSSWNKTLLPMPRELEPGEHIELTAAAVSGETTIVFGSVSQFPERTVAQFLPEEIASLVTEYGFGFSGVNLEVQGPFGMTIFAATREELEIPAEIWGRLSTGGYEQIYIWMSNDEGKTWRTARFEGGQYVESVVINDEGTVDVIGHGTFGPTRWTTSDGETWGANQITTQVEQVTPWGDGFAAIWWGPGYPDVATSSDGQRWTNIGLSQVLPSEIQWQVWPLMADDDVGLAAVVSGYRQEPGFSQPDPYLDKDGYRLWVDYDESHIGLFELEAERLIANYAIHTGTVDQNTILDLGQRTVTFLDPDSGEPLVTVTLDELRSAEDAAWSQENASRPLRGFFFSENGDQWSLQDMTEWSGSDDVMFMAAVKDRLIAVSLDQFWYRIETPQPRLWMGILPDR